MKRIVALLLSLLCLSFVFVGCSQAEKIDEGTDNGSKKSYEDTQYELGLSQLKEYKYNSAIESFTNVIEKDDTYVDAYVKRGDAYYEHGLAHGNDSGQFTNAIDDYEKAYSLDNTVDVSENIKECYKSVAAVCYADTTKVFEPAMKAGELTEDDIKQVLVQGYCMWNTADAHTQFFAFYSDNTAKRFDTANVEYLTEYTYSITSNNIKIKSKDGAEITWVFDKENMKITWDDDVVCTSPDSRCVFQAMSEEIENWFNDAVSDDFTQADMNASASGYYDYRKALTYELLDYLKLCMSEAEYSELVKAQEEWEVEKEEYQQAQSASVMGGSMYPMQYATAGASYYSMRFNDLLDKLPEI